MRVALIHDWLNGMRGGERCLEVLCEIFPEADIYTLFHLPEKISPTINKHLVINSGFARLPGINLFYRHLLPFFPVAASNLSKKLHAAHDISPYDLVISVSHCFAKNVVVPRGVPHLCYSLTPMRYIWDQYESYFANSKLEPLIRVVARELQRWDVARVSNVTKFVGISEFIRARIGRVYHRDASVVYPPVRTDWITPASPNETAQGFLCVNALVPYKNVRVIVDAFNELELPLTIVGKGPEEQRLRALAKGNISFVSDISDAELAGLYRKHKALVFAAVEDFGMTPVEMQAAGRPVIALGAGGSLETVNFGADSPSGVRFERLSTEAIVQAVEYFLDRERDFTVDNCIMHAHKFSLGRFYAEFSKQIEELGFSREIETKVIAHGTGEASLRRIHA